jgi:uncharacterized protein DUF1236
MRDEGRLKSRPFLMRWRCENVPQSFISHSENKDDGTSDHQEHLISPLVVGAGNANTREEMFMTNRLMLSVAAIALIAGAGAVNAQGTGGRESGGASTQQSAPSSAGGGAASGGAAMQHEGSERSPGASSGMKSESKPDMKASQSEQSPGAARNQRAEDAQGQKSKGMSSENETKGGMKSDNKNAQNREGRDRDQNAAQNREGRDRDNQNAQNRDRNDNMNAEGKSSTDMKSQTTTGQAGAGAKLSSEQRTKITTVIRNEHVAPVTNVNFAVSVGTRVPRDVSFHPIPSEVVTIYPEWRGYNYILVRQQIVVIDPSTFEIVAVLDV